MCVLVPDICRRIFFLSLVPSSHVYFSPTAYFLKHISVCVCLNAVCFSPLAMTPEHQRGAPKEEFFITDVAYCEQAVIFLKQAKLAQNNSQRRKEDSTLPVSIATLFTHAVQKWRTLEA